MDTVFINGSVITADIADSLAEAVAVKDDRIISVGTSAEIKNKH